MMTNIHNLSPYSYSGLASGSSSGKLYVPVNPSSVIYAQFDHISGVAAKSGQHGVSVTKIQILNALIENLSKLKTSSASNSQIKETNLTDEQVDVLIKNYQQQIQNTMAQAQNSPYFLTGARPEASALFSIDI